MAASGQNEGHVHAVRSHRQKAGQRQSCTSCDDDAGSKMHSAPRGLASLERTNRTMGVPGVAA
eukprot:9252813-Alexandrium_andersonii.AAC.1